MLTLFYLEVKDILPMITVEFNHTISRTAEQAPFFPGSNPSPEQQDHYDYTMYLVANGFGGIVSITHTEDEFNWQTQFTCNYDEWLQFKNFVETDAKFAESMRIGHNYGVQNNLNQIVTVVFKDSDGNIIDESGGF
jgi:hypothetical protein